MAKPVDLDKTSFEVLEVRVRNTGLALKDAAAALSSRCSDKITVREIEQGLIDVLGLDEITDMLDRDVDAPFILDALEDYDFARVRPEKLAEIVLTDSVIPSGVPLLLSEAEVKMKGEKWVVHKNDADPFPSNPHAHNYEQCLKMHLGTGDLYQRKERVPCGRMKRSVLIEFRDRLVQRNSSISLPPLAV